MPEPVFENLDAEAFHEKMEEADVVVLDVRTDNETRAGIIPGAVTGLDVYNGDFERGVAQMDKDKTYLVYCRSGVRSVSACEYMAKIGFSKLANLRGGIISWVTAQLPVSK